MDVGSAHTRLERVPPAGFAQALPSRRTNLRNSIRRQDPTAGRRHIRRFQMDTSINTTATNSATGNGASLHTLTAVAPTAPTTPVDPPAGKAKVSIGFLSRDTDAKLGSDTARIITGLTGNAAFPTPNPTVAELTTALNAFLTAVTAAHDSKVGRVQRTQQRANLCTLLRALAHYVDVASLGDLPTLLSSGFTAQQPRKPVGPLPAPVNLRFVRGKVSGTATARCNKEPRATAYQWRCAPAATPTAWLPVVTTPSAHYLFQGLMPLTIYIVEVCTVGTAGTSNWSETATLTVL
jgi:hypothetical protein